MFRKNDELEVLNYFDPCLRKFIILLKKECSICPLCSNPIDEITDRIRMYARINFLVYSYRYPLRTAARLAFQRACAFEVCFDSDTYPISRCLNELNINGTYINRLFTNKSFNSLFGASVSATLSLKMAGNDCIRVIRSIRSIRSTKLVRYI